MSILGHLVYDVAYARACMRVGVSARAVAPFVYSTHMCVLAAFLSVYVYVFLPSISFSSAAFKGIYVTGTCARGTGRPTLWTPLFAKGPIYSIPLSPSSPPYFYHPPFVSFIFLSAVSSCLIAIRSREACKWSKM